MGGVWISCVRGHAIDFDFDLDFVFCFGFGFGFTLGQCLSYLLCAHFDHVSKHCDQLTELNDCSTVLVLFLMSVEVKCKWKGWKVWCETMCLVWLCGQRAQHIDAGAPRGVIGHHLQ